MNAVGTAVLLLALAGVAAMAGCSQGDREAALLVFAAASLTDALEEVGDAYEMTGRARVDFSMGGSQMLAQQIASGAPADILISAGRSPVDFLARRGFTATGGADLLSNRLVVVRRAGAGGELSSMDQLASSAVGSVAIANPELAPAGRYAEESLVNLGLWEDVQAKLVIGADVRATLAYVESGNAEVALVYETDARLARNVDVLDLVPESSYTPVTYPAVLIEGAEHEGPAREFLEFLTSDEASRIFRAHGFVPIE